jgi:uncharacterized protein
MVMKMKCSRLSVMILGNSFAGAENQCWGLVEQLQRKVKSCHGMNLNVEIRRVLPTKNWIRFPPSLHILASGLLKQWTWVGLTEMHGSKNSNARMFQIPPYPDVIVASGRTTVPACVAFKRASQGRTYTVQIQHPRCDLRSFDAVIVPQHDLHWQTVGSLWPCRRQEKLPREIAGINQLFENGTSNIVATFGSIHRVNSASIRQAWVEDRLTLMPFISCGGRARVLTILIGGPTPNCRWDTQSLLDNLGKIVSLCQQDESQQRVSLLISLSRRSPANLSKDLKAWVDRNLTAFSSPVLIWDPSVQTSANPYRAMLHAADMIAVTADSVGMCSEACSTGKTVVTLLAHKCRGKFASFHANLEQGSYAMRVEALRALPAPLRDYGPQQGGAARAALKDTQLKDTERVADLVLPRILEHRRRWMGA